MHILYDFKNGCINNSQTVTSVYKPGTRHLGVIGRIWAKPMI